MCNFCGWSPCHTACPNAPEPKPLYICKHCGEGIFKEDDMLKVEDDYYHLEDCASDAALGIILANLDAKVCKAE